MFIDEIEFSSIIDVLLITCKLFLVMLIIIGHTYYNGVRALFIFPSIKSGTINIVFDCHLVI